MRKRKSEEKLKNTQPSAPRRKCGSSWRRWSSRPSRLAWPCCRGLQAGLVRDHSGGLVKQVLKNFCRIKHVTENKQRSFSSCPFIEEKEHLGCGIILYRTTSRSYLPSTVQSFVVKSVADKSFTIYKSVLPKLVNFCSNEGIRFNFVTDSCNKCQFILTFPPISSPTK